MPRNEKKMTEPEPKNISSIIDTMRTYFSKLLNPSFNQIKENQLHDTIKQLHDNINHISPHEKHILGNFLAFCDEKVEDVMIPRSDIFAVNIDISLTDLSKKIADTGHGRTLVYEDNLDNIIGFVHIKDLFKVVASNSSGFNLRKILRKPIFTAPSMKLMDLLTEMQKTHTHIAIVIDEYGGSDGIATIEDIMEAIVGQIEDEHDTDKDDPQYKIINPGEIITDARVEIEDLETALNVVLKQEDDDCDTIGGLILSRMGYMPEKGASIALADNIVATIIDTDARMLKKIKLTVSV